MNKFDIFYNIDDKAWETLSFSVSETIESVKNSTLKVVTDLVWFLKENKNFSINLCLSNDETVHHLNKTFRNMDKPTNVLSFANIDGEDFEDNLEKQTDIELGDIIISFERLQAEAKELDIPFKDHFEHLLTHGILHILGYDHIDDDERLEMEKIEIDILSLLGVPDPYQE